MSFCVLGKEITLNVLYHFSGISHFELSYKVAIQSISYVNQFLFRKIIPSSIYLSVVDAKLRLEMEENFQEQIRVYETKISNTIKVGESIYYNLPVVQYSPKASAGVAYRRFAKELISYES